MSEPLFVRQVSESFISQEIPILSAVCLLPMVLSLPQRMRVQIELQTGELLFVDCDMEEAKAFLQRLTFLCA